MNPLKKLVLLAAVATAVGISGWLVFHLLPQRTALSVAKGSTECMERGDAQCIYDSILDDERLALHLSPMKIKALLDQYVLPSYAGRQGDPETKIVPNESMGTVQYYMTWKRANQGPIMMATTAAATPSGAKSICTTQWMIFNAMEARYRKSPSDEKLMIFLRGLERDSETLSRLGIPGIYRPKTKTVTEWKSLILQYRHSAESVGWLKPGQQ